MTKNTHRRNISGQDMFVCFAYCCISGVSTGWATNNGLKK